MRVRVKICGVRHPEDAALAARLGADAVGMVFHRPAFRAVTPEQAASIVASLPPFVTPVGLFVDADAAAVSAAADRLRLGCVQLHGAERPEILQALSPGLRIIKAVRVDAAAASTLRLWAEARRRSLQSPDGAVLAGVVLESPGQTGGSGVANDFQRIAELRQAGLLDDLGSVILAGGLTPENLAEAIHLTHPDAVDVSSGVERERGRKDEELIRRFIAAATAA